MRKVWTRERIIRHLVEREAEGLPLTVGGQGVDKALYSATRRIFGSWRNAILAAGIAPERVLTWERWSPGRILGMVRNLARREHPLSTDEIDRRYGNLVTAARRHFGSWPKAMVAAGVDPTKLQRVVPWRQDRVIEAILTRALRGESLVARLVEPRSLVEASHKFFGSWSAAVEAAGLDPQATVLAPRRKSLPRGSSSASKPSSRDPRSPWSKPSIVAALQARLQSGKAMGFRALALDDPSLFRAIRRHLRGWAEALRAAGIDPEAHRHGVGRAAEDLPVVPPSQVKSMLRPETPA